MGINQSQFHPESENSTNSFKAFTYSIVGFAQDLRFYVQILVTLTSIFGIIKFKSLQRILFEIILCGSWRLKANNTIKQVIQGTHLRGLPKAI